MFCVFLFLCVVFVFLLLTATSESRCLAPGFFALFLLFLQYYRKVKMEGGESFIKMMEKMAQEDDIDGRMRVLSKDPRYATDSPNAPELSDVPQNKNKHTMR